MVEGGRCTHGTQADDRRKEPECTHQILEQLNKFLFSVSKKWNGSMCGAPMCIESKLLHPARLGGNTLWCMIKLSET